MPYQMDYLEPAPLDERAEQVMVPMRDGVHLATDVYLPPAPGRLPAVLVRLPYDKCARYTFMPQIAPYVMDRGYALVVQDVRGKFRSEGDTMPFAYEIEDGYDTLEWIVAQPWSDGVVGMWGDSYYGYTQWAAVASGHPALRAIVPRVTSTDFMDSLHWWGDAVLQLYGADYLAHFWVDRSIYDFPVDFDCRPLARIFDEGFEAIGRRSRAFDELMLNRRPGGLALWPAGRHPYECQKVPALHSVGWFDNVMPYSMRDYVALTAMPERSALQYLHAEPIDHENYRLEDVPIKPEDDHDDNDAAMERLIPRLMKPGVDFFDVFLRGRERPEAFPRARWRTGHGDWAEASTWPPEGARELRLYLGAPERTARDAEGGTLAATPESRADRAGWIHDPAQLVPSVTQDPFSILRDWRDESVIEGRRDVLTFTTDEAIAPLHLAGPATAHLVLESTGDTMHVHVKLLDVQPDGAARMLLRGQAFVACAAYGTSVSVGLGHTAYLLQPGHRLRLHVASSDHPLYLWHPGTAEDPWWATMTAQNGQTLHTGGGHGSCLDLMVLKEKE